MITPVQNVQYANISKQKTQTNLNSFGNLPTETAKKTASPSFWHNAALDVKNTFLDATAGYRDLYRAFREYQYSKLVAKELENHFVDFKNSDGNPVFNPNDFKRIAEHIKTPEQLELARKLCLLIEKIDSGLGGTKGEEIATVLKFVKTGSDCQLALGYAQDGYKSDEIGELLLSQAKLTSSNSYA